jgi:hypothetical protein
MDVLKLTKEELKNISKEDLLELYNESHSISHSYKILCRTILDEWKKDNNTWAIISLYGYIAGILLGLILYNVLK